MATTDLVGHQVHIRVSIGRTVKQSYGGLVHEALVVGDHLQELPLGVDPFNFAKTKLDDLLVEFTGRQANTAFSHLTYVGLAEDD